MLFATFWGKKRHLKQGQKTQKVGTTPKVPLLRIEPTMTK